MKNYEKFKVIRQKQGTIGIAGIVLLDHYTPQTWSAITMLIKFFSDHRDIKRIVDLGTGTGGLTLLFGVNMLQRDGKVLSFDIEPVQSEQARRDFEKLNITFEEKNIFKKDAVELARKFIEDERALVFCDNGHKVREFSTYTKILKKGDFIMAHDWGTEITKIDLPDLPLSVLEPYHQEDFDEAETFILCMRRI